MTVGTAARNKSPSWLRISTDYAKAPDDARQISSPEYLKCTPAPIENSTLDKGVIYSIGAGLAQVPARVRLHFINKNVRVAKP
jgi:hypothetical protein